MNIPTQGEFKISLWDRLQNGFDEGSSTPELVGGGIQFSLSFGQGKENRFSPNATIGENLDDLIGLAGSAKSLTSVPGVGAKATQAIPEIIDITHGAATNVINMLDKVTPNSTNKLDTVSPNTANSTNKNNKEVDTLEHFVTPSDMTVTVTQPKKK